MVNRQVQLYLLGIFINFIILYYTTGVKNCYCIDENYVFTKNMSFLIDNNDNALLLKYFTQAV